MIQFVKRPVQVIAGKFIFEVAPDSGPIEIGGFVAVDAFGFARAASIGGYVVSHIQYAQQEAITACKCGYPNEYNGTANQSDGSWKCTGCKLWESK